MWVRRRGEGGEGRRREDRKGRGGDGGEEGRRRKSLREELGDKEVKEKGKQG